MKRSQLIQELVKIYDTRPENCSSYHIIDMLIYAAEKRGVTYVDVSEPYEPLFGFYLEDKE